MVAIVPMDRVGSNLRGKRVVLDVGVRSRILRLVSGKMGIAASI